MISVCIATYNGEHYISEQIQSILVQLSINDEIVISDDCSTDNTLDIIKSFNDDRIKIFTGIKHKSLSFNFENALKNAKGDYIFLSDQDDVWLPDKVETTMRYLKHYSCIISDAYVVDSNLQIIHSSFFKLNNSKQSRFYNLVVSNSYIGCCMAFSKEVLARCLPFPSDIPLHDLWIGNVAAFYYDSKLVPEKLIKFRRHGANNSMSASRSKNSLIHKLRTRSIILKNLVSIR